MIWADRVAVVLAILLSPIVFLNESPSAALTGVAIVVGLVWFILRGIDFIFSGAIRNG